jgi:serine/threonine protein phosphatase PrpC
MEDASIYEVELGDGNALFAVFDGHGGRHSLIQVMKSASLWRASLSTS